MPLKQPYQKLLQRYSCLARLSLVVASPILPHTDKCLCALQFQTSILAGSRPSIQFNNKKPTARAGEKKMTSKCHFLTTGEVLLLSELV